MTRNTSPFLAKPALLLGAGLLGILVATAAGPALAKLPAPTDEAKAKAAEAAAKTAHVGKIDGYKLCLAMDKAATGYRDAAKKTGKAVAAPVDTPACADPGPFVYAAPDAAPASAAGAAAAPAPAPTVAATAAKK